MRRCILPFLWRTWRQEDPPRKRVSRGEGRNAMAKDARMRREKVKGKQNKKNVKKWWQKDFITIVVVCFSRCLFAGQRNHNGFGLVFGDFGCLLICWNGIVVLALLHFHIAIVPAYLEHAFVCSELALLVGIRF